MTSTKFSKMLKKSTATFDDLMELLDGPIISDAEGKAMLPKWRPMKPSQSDKLMKQAFMAILTNLHLLRIQHLQKHSNINELRAASIAIVKTEKERKPGVINPKTLTLERSIKIIEKRLEFIENLFREVLQLYERQTGKGWIPEGEKK